jgi:hypothetical protein
MRRPTDTNYYMGQLVGEIIYIKYLPTLETDMIHTNNRVRLTDPEDLRENVRLNYCMKALLETRDRGYEEKYKEFHTNWLAHTNMLAKKYLPEKIECRVTQFEVTDVDSFKEGLRDYLWDCDVSWYIPQDDFLQPNFEGAWCTTIILTRTV